MTATDPRPDARGVAELGTATQRGITPRPTGNRSTTDAFNDPPTPVTDLETVKNRSRPDASATTFSDLGGDQTDTTKTRSRRQPTLHFDQKPSDLQRAGGATPTPTAIKTDRIRDPFSTPPSPEPDQNRSATSAPEARERDRTANETDRQPWNPKGDITTNLRSKASEHRRLRRAGPHPRSHQNRSTSEVPRGGTATTRQPKPIVHHPAQRAGPSTRADQN